MLLLLKSIGSRISKLLHRFTNRTGRHDHTDHVSASMWRKILVRVDLQCKVFEEERMIAPIAYNAGHFYNEKVPYWQDWLVTLSSSAGYLSDSYSLCHW